MKKLLKNTFLTTALLCFSNGLLAEEMFMSHKDTTFNPSHTNSFTFMAGANSSLMKAADMSNVAFSYGKKLDEYWIDTNIIMTKGLFSKFSSNNVTATGATDEELSEQENSLTTIGVGIGRETRYAQTFLPINDVYELMAANLTYNSYEEDFSAHRFTGPGLLAKFSIYKKFNDFFSAGAHFNYNLAVVKRGQEVDTESSSQRSLTLGFLTVGLNLSFYL